MPHTICLKLINPLCNVNRNFYHHMPRGLYISEPRKATTDRSGIYAAGVPVSEYHVRDPRS